MAKGKPKSNLFSGGLLATSTVAPETTTKPQEEEKALSPLPSITAAEEEDDPFFGGTKRIRQMTQETEAIADTNAIPRIAIDLLDDNPYQPRLKMNESKLQTLTGEIRDHGFKGALLARHHPQNKEKYQLVFGHRRREAARRAGLIEIPVIIDDTVTDQEMRAVALTENLLREDLSPVEEAYAFKELLKEMTQQQLADRLGVSRGYIRNRADILDAPEDVQDMVETKPDTMKAVVYLKDEKDEAIRKEAIQALLEENITINQLKAFMENLRKARQEPEPIVAETPAMPQAPSVEAEAIHQPEPATTQTPNNQEVTRTAASIPPSPQPKRETIIQQSKEQTEAVTDRTKIEAFIKYLQAYNVRLQKRPLTGEERGALDNLLTAARAIMETH